ncbi:MAG: ATP-binding protein, partial [Sphingopyxis sp.]
MPLDRDDVGVAIAVHALIFQRRLAPAALAGAYQRLDRAHRQPVLDDLAREALGALGADQRARIFEPFYRLPGASEREGGVGLGLSLVKTIIERHGGRVRCEDRPGG